jgi:hypothetical protein
MPLRPLPIAVDVVRRLRSLLSCRFDSFRAVETKWDAVFVQIGFRAASSTLTHWIHLGMRLCIALVHSHLPTALDKIIKSTGYYYRSRYPIKILTGSGSVR